MLGQLALAAFAPVGAVLWGPESSPGAASICLLALSIPCWAFAADPIWDPVVAARRRAAATHFAGEYLVCGLELYRLEQMGREWALVENCVTLELFDLPLEGLRLFAPLRRISGMDRA